MPITQFQPINYGGGEIGTGIAKGIQGLGESIAYGIAEKKERQARRRAMLVNLSDKIDKYSAYFDDNKEIYNDMAMGYADYVQQLSIKRKGNITTDDLLDVMRKKNMINNKISQIKQEEKYIQTQMKTVFEDAKGTWDREEFNKKFDEYFEAKRGGEDISPPNMLVKSKIAPGPYYSGYKINKTGQPLGLEEKLVDNMKKTYTTWSRKKDNEAQVMSDFISNEGLRRGMMDDWNKLNDEEKQSYITQATTQIDGRKNLIDPKKTEYKSEDERQSVINSQAAMLYNIDEHADKIQPPTLFSEVQYKPTGKKEKDEKLIDISEIEPNPISLFGKDYNIINIQKATGAKKIVNMLLPDSAIERKYKEQRDKTYKKAVPKTLFGKYRKPRIEEETKKVNVLSYGKPEGAGRYGQYEIVGYDPDIDKIILTKYMTEKEKEKIRANAFGGFEGLSYTKYNMANVIEVPRKDFNMNLLKDVVNIGGFNKITTKQPEEIDKLGLFK